MDERVESLAELLELRAGEDPDRPLFTFLADDGSTEGVRTTGELSARARAGAVRIRESCAPGDRILLVAPPGLDYIDAFFACVAAGVYAVPAYPPDPLRLSRTVPRLAAIVRDARPSAILTTALLRSLAEPVRELAPELSDIAWIAIDEVDPQLAEAYVRPVLSRDDPAYLQYTSGSTADPRGVIVTNDNVLRHVAEIVQVTRRSPRSKIVSWMPPYHDFGLLGSIVLPLIGRACSVLMSPLAFLRSPAVWLRALSEHGGTTTQAATFALELCLRKVDPDACGDVDLSGVDMIGIGGEPIRLESVRRFEDAFACRGLRRGTFAPGWGLAEATLVLTGRAPGPLLVRNLRASALRRGRTVEVSARSADSLEIAGCGPPFPSNEVLAVDPETRMPCPPGVVGELWGAGPGICPGYWERPDDSRETFGNRLADGRGPYLRTGDLGFLDGGEVFVTGRLKDVIIIRGQNHYPQDIERSAEQAHPAIRPGCVAAFAVDVGGAERLFLAAEVRPDERLDTTAVADGVRAAVARDHEVQVYSVVLLPPGGLPKTSSGKVQRQPCRRQLLDGTLEVLARVDPAREEGGSGVGRPAAADDPEDAVLDWLVARFAEALELRPQAIALDSPIVALGIDSLAALSLVQAVEDRFACTVPVSSFFEEMTLRDLAGLVGSAHRTGERAWTGLIPAHGDPEYRLSHGQRGLWFLTRLAPTSSAYNLAHAARIRGPLDVAALERAFRGVLERHEALRCTFHAGPDGEPLQRVAARVEGFFTRRSLAGAGDAEVAAVVDASAAEPFDLEARPPFRVVLLERSADEHVLVVVTHHLVADFWSLVVVNRELERLFVAECGGAPADLPGATWQHRDQVRAEGELLAGPRGARLWSYWEEQLAGELPVLELPADRPRPVVQSFQGAVVRTVLAPDLAARVRRSAAEAATTPFVLLLAAFQCLLHRLSRQAEVIVGSPLSGRKRREWTDVVGYFANPVPLRARFTGNPSFRDVVARARIAVLGALDHQEIAFPLLVERRNPPRDASRSPIFQAMFTYPQAPEGWLDEGLLPLSPAAGAARMRAGGLTIEPWTPVDRGGAQFDLTLMAVEQGGAVELVWEYDSALFDAATIERFAAHYATLLEAAAERPATPVAELPLLDREELAFVVDECNATGRELPPDATVHRMIAERVARTPDAPALRSGEDWIAAGELELRAARLALRLRGAGVARGARVGVLLERSPEMVLALLGVLHAGAAYVPLDPAQPVERLRAMIEDAGAAPVLCDAASQALVAELGATPLRIDLADGAGATPPEVVPGTGGDACDVTGDDPAYVIYTSGSTGKPKGVEITHRALANLLLSMRETPGLGPEDTLLAVTTISFDIAALEIFLPLLAGARLVLASRDEAADGRTLRRALRDAGATVMQATPASWRMLVGAGWEGGPGFKVLCGGDVLPRDLADALLARAGSVWNLYGPTETTIWSSVARVAPGDGPVPVGHPIANTRLHVLDERLEPLPVGVPGELFIGGLGLARGYVGLPELTRERFVAAPARLGGRLYRTGDLARRRADGSLEVLGRNDRQVKLRGFRVELGEIEAALSRHPAVADCAVVTVGEGEARRLAAYVVPRPQVGAVEGVRAFLLERLPHYMVPSFVVALERLPLTHAGKVDRKRLPDPERGTSRSGADGAPHDDRERLLLEIWRQVLHVADLGVDDDFFSVGGDSLRAAELAARVSRATGCELGVRDLLAHPTVAAVARHIGEIADRRGVASGPATRPPAAPAVAPAFVEIERRPLLTLLAAGKIAPVDAAALAYLPASLPALLDVPREEIVEDWFGRLPLFAGVLSTTLGRVGLVLLPHFDDDLYQALPELRSALHEGVEIGRQIGAQTISLTGLLPAVTDQGRDLLAPPEPPSATAEWEAPRAAPPALTTGHATTAATVVLSVARILAESGRDLAQETVAVLGVGSVGLAALRLLLRCLPEPERILLCDLYRRRDHLGAIRRELIDVYGVTARIDTLETRDDVPPALYEASLVIGATNVGGVLDVARLRPGTLIVDDSAPHCFDRAAAELRFRERGDVLFTEGGVLKAPEPIPRLLYLPRGAERLARLLPGGLPGMPGVSRADEITGCVLSSLLSTRFADLPPTIGEVDPDVSVRHYERLRALGYDGADLHCEGFALAPESVARFREHAGVASGVPPGR